MLGTETLLNKFEQKEVDCEEYLGTQLQETGMNLMEFGKPQAFAFVSGAVWPFVSAALHVSFHSPC